MKNLTKLFLALALAVSAGAALSACDDSAGVSLSSFSILNSGG